MKGKIFLLFMLLDSEIEVFLCFHVGNVNMQTCMF